VRIIEVEPTIFAGIKKSPRRCLDEVRKPMASELSSY
jgi:hypothetical protein